VQLSSSLAISPLYIPFIALGCCCSLSSRHYWFSISCCPYCSSSHRHCHSRLGFLRCCVVQSLSLSFPVLQKIMISSLRFLFFFFQLSMASNALSNNNIVFKKLKAKFENKVSFLIFNFYFPFNSTIHILISLYVHEFHFFFLIYEIYFHICLSRASPKFDFLISMFFFVFFFICVSIAMRIPRHLSCMGSSFASIAPSYDRRRKR